MRTCKVCGADKPLDAFRPNSQNPKWRLLRTREAGGMSHAKAVARKYGVKL